MYWTMAIITTIKMVVGIGKDSADTTPAQLAATLLNQNQNNQQLRLSQHNKST